MKKEEIIPEFSLKGIDPQRKEKIFKITDFLNKNKYIILYFYPKDNTPGCTKEAEDFKNKLDEIKDFAFIIGISPDSIKSHINFHAKHNLNFYLMSDTEKKILKEFDAYGEKKMFGKTKIGVIRSTYIISPQGKILKKYTNVRVKGHAEKIIEDIINHKNQKKE